MPSAEFLSRQISAGVFQKLDKSKLPNLSNMWDEVQKRVAVYDPDNAYSVTYMWGTTGVGINDKKVAEALPNAPTNSWALVFDPKNAEKLADLRHRHAGHRQRADPGRAQLSRARPEFDERRRHR